MSSALYPYKVRIDRFRPEKGRRLVVFSDVHADLSSLRRALDAAQLRPDDILLPVGDYIERGPDSIGTLRFMMALSERYEMHPVAGNVDAYVLWMLTGPVPAADGSLRRALAFRSPRECRFAREARAALGLEDEPALHPELDPSLPDPRCVPETAAETEALHAFRDRIREAYAAEIRWLASLPTVVDTPQRILVHGGLPHEDLDALEGTPAWNLTKNDNFVGQGLSFSRTVIVGHWPAILYRPRIPDSRPFWAREQNILSIDGGSGVKPDGQVNVLVFPDADAAPEEYELYSADALPQVTALDAQAASEDAFSFHWGDHYADVLRREGDCALIRHRSSGRELWVPASFIFLDGSPAGVEDSTTYELPVSPGDRLSLICRCSRGCVVKKDGVTGWYRGRLAED